MIKKPFVVLSSALAVALLAGCENETPLLPSEDVSAVASLAKETLRQDYVAALEKQYPDQLCGAVWQTIVDRQGQKTEDLVGACRNSQNVWVLVDNLDM